MSDILATEDVKKLFFKLSLPAILAQLVSLVYNIVDRIYIGHMEDAARALTGVGVNVPIIIILTGFCALVGMGGAPKAAISLGANDLNKAERIIGTAFTSGLIGSIILSLIVFIAPRPILMQLGADENTIDYAMDYLRIYIMGAPFLVISFSMNAFINTQGFAKVSMFTTMIGAILNIILDPIFIFILDMGVAGAALATVISQFISCIWVLKFLTSDKPKVKLKREYLKFDLDIFLAIASLGLSPLLMQFTSAITVIAFNRNLLHYGGFKYVGAFSIIASINQLIILPVMGFAQGAQPITSFNYGSKNFKRVKESMYMLLKTGIIYAVVFFIIIFTNPKIFPSIFTSDSELVDITASTLKIFYLGLIPLAFQITIQNCILAISNAKLSIFLATFRKLGLLIPLIYILPQLLSQKVLAITLAEPIADTISGLTSVFIFIRYIRILWRPNE